jgi:hypothetical protein
MARHFLYLTNEKIISLTVDGKHITARRDFDVSAEGAQPFEAHLSGLRTLPTVLLTDLAEEDFRLDTIAHLGGKDQQVVLARRLSQVYRGTMYRQALVQGREAEGRRDDRVVYIAITNAEVLQPWMDILERFEVPLVGVNSVAAYSGELLKMLDLEFPHTLLVTLAPGGALRQTYFKGAEVKFTRLASDLLQDGQTLGEAIGEETARTWQYLDNLRMFAASDLLEVCVVCHPKDKQAIAPSLRGFAQMQYRILDSEQVAQKIGLKPPPVGNSAEELFVCLFASKPAPNLYATVEQRRFGALRTARIGLRVAGIVAMAVAAIWGAGNLYLALENRAHDAEITGQVADLTRESQMITRSMPEQGVAGETMRDSVALYNAMLRDSPSVRDFLVPVSKVLSAHPRIRLSQVAWQTSQDGKGTPFIKPISPRNAPSVKSTTKPADGTVAPTQPPQESATPQFEGGRAQVATIEAAVAAFEGDYRGALAEIDRFVDDLNRIPGYSASLVESPLDTKPGSSISARFSQKPTGDAEGRLVVRVTRQPKGQT